MTKFLVLTLISIFTLSGCFKNKTSTGDKPPQSVYNLSIPSISTGKEVNLNAYKNKTLLIVNIASRCGYTGQLEGLEKLHNKYKERGFKVIGIPSNDFGKQTPENDQDMKKFCLLNYGVSFPLTTKVSVSGSKKHALIAGLIALSSNKEEVAWNFEKFLIDKNGKVVNRFKSSIAPEDETLTSAIEAVL